MDDGYEKDVVYDGMHIMVDGCGKIILELT